VSSILDLSQATRLFYGADELRELHYNGERLYAGKHPSLLFHPGDVGYWPGGFDPASGRVFTDAGVTLATTFGQTIGQSTREAGTLNAAQATAGDRPLTARRPQGGPRNLFVQTDSSPSALIGTTVESGTIPTGAGNSPAWDFTAGVLDGLSSVGLSKQYPNAVGVNVTLSAFVDAGVNRYIYFSTNNGGAQNNVGAKYRYDTQTATITQLFAANIQAVAPKVETVSGTIFRVTISVRPNSAAGSKFYGVYCSSTSEATGSLTYIRATVAPAGLFRVGGWQAEPLGDAALNPTATAYQKVTTAYDVTEAGQPDRWSAVNVSSDSLNLTLPAGTYTRAWVTSAGGVTIQTGQALSGTEDVLRATETADVLYINRNLSGEEQGRLTEYWQERYAA